MTRYTCKKCRAMVCIIPRGKVPDNGLCRACGISVFATHESNEFLRRTSEVPGCPMEWVRYGDHCEAIRELREEMARLAVLAQDVIEQHNHDREVRAHALQSAIKSIRATYYATISTLPPDSKKAIMEKYGE